MSKQCCSSCGCDDDDCKCKRGKRGHRGHRGHRGKEGPPGPASGGLLKFSGEVGSDPEQTIVSYLADTGISVVIPSIFPPGYPVAVPRNLRNLATNLFYAVQDGQTVIIELVKNLSTLPVVIATITYVSGEGPGIKTALFGPEPFAGPPIPDTFDLRVTTTNLISSEGLVNVSATVGVE